MNYRKSFIHAFVFLWIFTSAKSQQLFYQLSMPEPQTHYFEVEINVDNLTKITEIKDKKYIDFKLPVWTPGSYLVREYAKNVEGFEAKNANNPLNSEKINKNTWRVYCNEASRLTVKYRVYAYEMSVRTSFLDDSHGYLNGASIFMYVPQLKNTAAQLKIIPYKNWSTISTALKKESNSTFLIPDYDTLVDSPIEIGNQKELNFVSSGIPHRIAMYSNTNLVYDEKTLLEDYKKVTETAASVVGEHPCSDYLFIVHHLPNIGGGLEHLNSTTCQTSPNAYATSAAYKSFLSLIAHEYFHLWNVKRIRPVALGPFDYDNENYTHLLWVSEGITSFYQEYILRRANILSSDEYLFKVAAGINSIENQAGNKVQSAAESSWDAWIKYYRPNENSKNSTISYYEKGGVLGGLLNLYILTETKGARNLDDLFKYLWTTYYKNKKRGFTDEEFQKACETVIGGDKAHEKMDIFFKKYVWGTESIDYNSFFAPVGYQLVDAYANTNNPYLGASISNGKITQVLKGSGAYEDGLNVNDEIVEVDGEASNNPTSFIQNKKVGDVLTIKLKRSGQFFTYSVHLKRNPTAQYSLVKLANPSAAQEELRKKWLYE